MNTLTTQHIQPRTSRYRRLTMGIICQSKSGAVCLWNINAIGNQPVVFNHDQLSSEEAGMT
jgi:hypothetical protein